MTRQIKLLVFSLNDQLCALNLLQVKQVIRSAYATPLPEAPDIVLGAINLHGKVVPLLSTRRRFGFVDREVKVEDQFIIAQAKARTVALAVDEVQGIVERPESQIVAAETIVGGLKHVDGVIQLDDGLALIHDLETFLSLDEQHQLDHALSAEECDAR